jgi:hypothetical protein
MTVNYCAPIEQGDSISTFAWSRPTARRSTGASELTQRGGEVATLATAVFAGPSVMDAPACAVSARLVQEQIRPYPRSRPPGPISMIFALSRAADFGGTVPRDPRAPVKLWIGDRIPRTIDMLSLMSMSDAFFARIFHVRREFVPFGTVSLTTYFHADAGDLAAEDTTRVLAVADAKIFHKSYGDQNGELWSPNGRLLATTTQIAYFKA